MKRRLEILWDKRGSIEVIDLGCEFFLVRFFNSKNLDFALTEGPWKILDHYLSVRLWKPDFDPTTTTIDTVAAWVKLPGLAIEYYNRTILRKIGNIIGRTLKIDSNTAEVSRGKFARLCVEVALIKPLVAQYQINGVNHSIEYEGLHQVCFSCGRVGHEKESCPVKERNQVQNHQLNGAPLVPQQEEEDRGIPVQQNSNKDKEVMKEKGEEYRP
ncbi:hypothetical protein Ahy_A03g011470 [Arachis hypogaea]|uniref:CCHC-type domain-containing protein n=1 Tax=Arachis hypogaea TaxID=3818 RepID=A0A445DQT3_ARAHY|nr:hypothetical protein Ahy_A03g011470 [Arachis hypogaea]